MAMWIFDHALKKTLGEGLFFKQNIFVSKYNFGLHYYMMTIINASLYWNPVVPGPHVPGPRVQLRALSCKKLHEFYIKSVR